MWGVQLIWESYYVIHGTVPGIADVVTVVGIQRDNTASCQINRDHPNSREKMRDFTVEFLKCAKFHGKFTEGVWEIHGAPQPLFRGAVLMQTKKSVE